MYHFKLLFFYCSLFLISFHLQAQKKYSGTVVNIETLLPIADVSIAVLDTDKGTYTSENGFFNFVGLQDNAVLKVSKIGYFSLEVKITTLQKTIYLTPKVSQLKEVVIRNFSSSQLKRIAPDQIYLSKADIKRLPFILGEKDVVKLIQYTPGVQQATEGQSGLLVRGGNGSMNLTLLDNIYLHNTSHLGGVFSAINSDFVHSLNFSKAGFDAQYGGRLSSVTDIKTLKPSKKTFFEGSLGLLSTKLTGYIKLNKNHSLLLSGRRTYLEAFKPFSNDDTSILSKDKSYFLHDFFIKHSVKTSNKGRLETSLYLTEDNFKDQTKGRNRRLKWGNFLLGTTYNHQFTTTFSSSTTLAHSAYKFTFGDNEFPFKYSAKSTFDVFSLKQMFLYNKLNGYVLKWGIDYNKNKILPKRVIASIQNVPLSILNQETYYYDAISSYGDMEFATSSKTKIKAGLRATLFATKSNTLVDSDNRFVLEPRLSVKYQFKDTQAYKFSYQRLNQFIHQASVGSFSLPADFFVISTQNIKPQLVNQWSAGYVLEKNGLQLNTALYYKNVSRYTEFENGSVNNLFSNNIYNDIIVGTFDSFGLEISVNKKINKLTAQLALTLSRTLAKFNEINDSQYFPTTFDRPVNINSILHYRLNNRIELGALFLFTSGQNYTRPSNLRIVGERPILSFESKNASRYPNYHRLDLSCTYAFKQKGRWKSKLNVTLYNAYNNKNPFQINFSTQGGIDNSSIEIEENIDYLFPLLPTLNWIFSF